MIQTLAEVVDDREGFLLRLDKGNERLGSLSVYDRSVMDGVVVWPNKVAMQFFESIYRFDTHVVPGGLPGSGMAIGDFLDHQGSRYVSTHHGVMTSNSAAIHLVRPHETLYREWAEGLPKFHGQVKAFLGAVPKKYAARFAYAMDVNEHRWHEAYTGFCYVGSPHIDFVNALAELATCVSANKTEQALFETARQLERQLRPFVGLVDSVAAIRSKLRHGGIPSIADGMIGLSAPSASGGASLHTYRAKDDLTDCLPGPDALIMIGAQAHTNSVIHIGAGSTPGEHCVLCAPRTPFFPQVQERIESDPNLVEHWKNTLTEGCSLENFMPWQTSADQTKLDVITDVVPRFIPSRVLGFWIDLTTEFRVAHLHPIISEAAFHRNQELIDQQGWNVSRPEIKELLIETTQGYCKFGDSIFGSAA